MNIREAQLTDNNKENLNSGVNDVNYVHIEHHYADLFLAFNSRFPALVIEFASQISYRLPMLDTITIPLFAEVFAMEQPLAIRDGQMI